MSEDKESAPTGADHGGKLDKNAAPTGGGIAVSVPESKSLADKLVELYRDSKKKYSDEVLKKK